MVKLFWEPILGIFYLYDFSKYTVVALASAEISVLLASWGLARLTENGTNNESMAQIMCQWHKLCVDGTNYVSIAQIMSHPVLFYKN